ncbi:zinc-binding metallopeptidase family protein [Acidisphaera rubrifaciens]|uniref:Zinc-ribbon domain-containing protein n=1 Tax=Acidisphaera rubrifaciens HS-AP3 TaxID=1231350 RepID=A0A0D6P9T1_9PROT|nr:putative zinc-binding peptidase [Acidisphaera rubrifaciens]GAN77963.1 hypothetical protein Asru_0546_01 [Acidisphaera rubrifaciens HS-AP3]
MRLFRCQACEQVLYFENRLCTQCGHRVGYLPGAGALTAVEPDGEGWTALAEPDRPLRFCTNAEADACNWLVADGGDYCDACRHNRTIPDLDQAPNLDRWRKVEQAKHRLFYTLLRLGLPVATRADDPAHGLAFDILAAPRAGETQVMTGHDEGVITLSLAEADDVEREKLREEMGEPYRTVLGHFRHEIGHYFWDVLVRDAPDAAARLDRFRALFGDEREDYQAALQRHYAEGAPADWQNRFVSAYATAHPWEDFAETWAHYLHIVDTLETAAAFGVDLHPVASADESLVAEIHFDPHEPDTFDRLIAAWLPLTLAVNSLNRSMGQPDFYPFVLSPPAVEKLAYVHALVHGGPDAG